MPFLWKNSVEEDQQAFSVGKTADEVFASIWSRRKRDAFQDAVCIRSVGMGGYNTSSSYDILMKLAEVEQIVPQTSGKMQTIALVDPYAWNGVRNQYNDGIRMNHLLVPTIQKGSNLTLGISNKDNTFVHAIDFQRERFSGEVFQILIDLTGALREDNKVFGHWHDVLQSRE